MYIANYSPTCAFKNEQWSLYIAHLYTCAIQCSCKVKNILFVKKYTKVYQIWHRVQMIFLLFEELKGKPLALFY